RADDGLHAPPGEPLPGGGRRGAERAARGHLLAAPRLAVADGRARASGVRDGPGAAGGTHGGLERDQRAPEPGRRDPAALRRHPPRSLLLRLAARAGRCAEGPLRPPAPGAVPHPPGAGGAMSGLVVEGLSVERGRRRVLDRVSLGLAPGEIVAVIGPNGAGKSSLLEAILGFLPVAAGRVTFEGRALRDLASRARVFSFLPEEAEPPAEVRVSTLLAHAERFGRPPDGLAAALLERLGLGPLAGARAGRAGGRVAGGHLHRAAARGDACSSVSSRSCCARASPGSRRRSRRCWWGTASCWRSTSTRRGRAPSPGRA